MAMHTLGRAFERALATLRQTAGDSIAGHGELVIWRHQLLGERNPLANNAEGMDPHGLFWKTRDFVVGASTQYVEPRGGSSPGGRTFYMQVEPSPGDLIITLATRPRTEAEALAAPRAGVWKVRPGGVDVRRDAEGRIVIATVRTNAHFRGQTSDYQYDPSTL